MRGYLLLAGAAALLSSALVIAQDAPESLLPPGFDRPAPKPARPAAPAAPATPAAAAATSVTPAGAASPAKPVQAGALPSGPASGLPSLDALLAMTPEELDVALNVRPTDDIPPGARRALRRTGLLAEDEGGLPFWQLARQDQGLVRASLAGNNGKLVSRWGHILLRRALVSRLDAPAGMDGAEFVALRAALLLRMGEGDAARALVQDVDTANLSPVLTQVARDAYVATGDFTGICPAVQLQGAAVKDKPWQVWTAICDSFAGEGSRGLASLDRLTYYGAMPRVDMLLAQKYAGAAGNGRRAVKVEWNGVKDLTPWRYAMTTAIGLQPPADLLKQAGDSVTFLAAGSPALALESRVSAAETAAACGVLSSDALVDLYGQIYDGGDSQGEWPTRAARLREAFMAERVADRVAAMRDLWGDGSDAQLTYARQVLTARAAARVPVSADLADDAGPLLAAMLTAGLDRNAQRWVSVVPRGSQGWALLALAIPGTAPADAAAIDDFHGKDGSPNQRKSRFLVAGLAGLGRLPMVSAQDLAGKYGFTLDRPSRWSNAIEKAASFNNATLVALLAGLGMQGAGWEKMTPRNLYHIVGALNRVGLSAEARMIAAEAVARG